MLRLLIYCFSVFAIILIMAGCQADELTHNITHVNTAVITTNPHRVTIDSAASTANRLISMISGDATTRSEMRKIKSFEVMMSPATRAAGDIDTALYLINYYEGGFALLGADDRLPSVFAISDEGCLQWEDTVNNKGLEMYYDYITDAITYATGNVYGTNDIGTGGIIVAPPGGERQVPYINEKCAPRLNPDVRKWHQDEPFNSLCPFSKENKSKRCLVGSMPLSCAMIMSYYEKPKSIKNQDGIYRRLDWVSMKADNNYSNLHFLLRTLGDSLHTNANYDLNVTGCDPDSAMPVLTKYLGNCNYEEEFIPNNVKQWLGMTEKPAWDPSNEMFLEVPGGPVFISAYSPQEGIYERKRHNWVIDGYIQMKMRNKLDEDGHDLAKNYEDLFHCVWGWGGENNGYFNWSVNLGFKDNPISNIGGKDIKDINDPADNPAPNYWYFNTIFDLIGNFEK